jgi:Fe-S-cluster containining protein
MSFPCTKCGACCKNISGFGLPTKPETTECLYLGENNECKVYDTRPDVCRIDDIYNKSFQNLDKDYFYKVTADSCNYLIDKEGIDPKFKIHIEYEEGKPNAKTSSRTQH